MTSIEVLDIIKRMIGTILREQSEPSMFDYPEMTVEGLLRVVERLRSAEEHQMESLSTPESSEPQERILSREIEVVMRRSESHLTRLIYERVAGKAPDPLEAGWRACLAELSRVIEDYS